MHSSSLFSLSGCTKKIFKNSCFLKCEEKTISILIFHVTVHIFIYFFIAIIIGKFHRDNLSNDKQGLLLWHNSLHAYNRILHICMVLLHDDFQPNVL